MIGGMKNFELQGLPWNVIFGAGAVRRLPQILEQKGLRRALILSTPGRTQHAGLLQSVMGSSAAGLFTGAAVHVPTGVVEEAGRAARACAADCTVSIGGGSTTGLGKLLRREVGLPQIAIPTTYAGSEMTPIWGETSGKTKRTGRDPQVLPVAVIYDPELLVTLPPAIAGPSALNAMAQAIANISTNPIVGLLAREAIRVLAKGLPRVMHDNRNVDAHAVMLHGACLAGAALGLGRSGLHHRLCHLLGGIYSLPHAETHAVILPYSVAQTARTAPEDAALIASVLGAGDAASHLYRFLKEFCPRHSLRALGLTDSEIEFAVAAAGVDAQASADMRRVLMEALAGNPPVAV